MINLLCISKMSNKFDLDELVVYRGIRKRPVKVSSTRESKLITDNTPSTTTKSNLYSKVLIMSDMVSIDSDIIVFDGCTLTITGSECFHILGDSQVTIKDCCINIIGVDAQTIFKMSDKSILNSRNNVFNIDNSKIDVINVFDVTENVDINSIRDVFIIKSMSHLSLNVNERSVVANPIVITQKEIYTSSTVYNPTIIGSRVMKDTITIDDEMGLENIVIGSSYKDIKSSTSIVLKSNATISKPINISIEKDLSIASDDSIKSLTLVNSRFILGKLVLDNINLSQCNINLTNTRVIMHLVNIIDSYIVANGSTIIMSNTKSSNSKIECSASRISIRTSELTYLSICESKGSIEESSCDDIDVESSKNIKLISISCKKLKLHKISEVSITDLISCDLMEIRSGSTAIINRYKALNVIVGSLGTILLSYTNNHRNYSDSSLNNGENATVLVV